MEKTFIILERLTPEQMVVLLKDQPPPVMALVLAHLSPKLSGQTLKLLDKNLQTNLMQRLAKLDQNTPDAWEITLQEIVKQANHFVLANETKRGGPQFVAKMLNQLDTDSRENLLEKLKLRSEPLTDAIKEKMFVFSDIASFSDAEIKEVLRYIPLSDWAIALRLAADELKDKILQNISSRSKDILLDEIQNGKKVLKSDIELLQKKICAEILLRKKD